MSSFGSAWKKKTPVCREETRNLFLAHEWQRQRETGFLAAPINKRHYRVPKRKAWYFKSSDEQGTPTLHTVRSSLSDGMLYQTTHGATRLVDSWKSDREPALRNANLKGVFNFGFSPNGSVLTAVCDNRAILCFDPHNRKLINYKLAAHDSCANHTSFIDDNLFVTASDDKSLRIWDVRKLVCPINVLLGHRQWIKNVEVFQNHLISSSFDGGILAWDIKSDPGGHIEPEQLFHMDSLVRSTVAPRSGKLVISTNKGYLMVIHQLDLSTLAADLQHFEPDLYVYLQMSHDTVRSLDAQRFTHLFDRNRLRNRLELITDFYQENDAENIISLQVNPQETCILTRNVNSDECSEYTSVHDLRENPRSKLSAKLRYSNHVTTYIPYSDSEGEDDDGDEDAADNSSNHGSRSSRSRSSSVASTSSLHSGSSSQVAEGGTHLCSSGYQDAQHQRQMSMGAGSSYGSGTSMGSQMGGSMQMGGGGGGGGAGSGQSYQQYDPSFLFQDNPLRVTVVSTRQTVQKNYDKIVQRVRRIAEDNERQSDHVTLVLDAANTKTFVMVNGLEQPPREAIGPQAHASAASSDLRTPPDNRSSGGNSGSYAGGSSGLGGATWSYSSASFVEVHKNKPRLKFYSKENYDRCALMYIKEVSFSGDGRVVCSPLARGVRLLAFDEECSDISAITTRQPQEFTELISIRSHRNIVLCSRFSPTQGTLVSGCLSGEVCFYQPMI